jgi:GntR family transcriptional regulator/MocR family aminotransferase
MPKRAMPADRPEILLDASLTTPLYKQLYGRLRGAILAGQLPCGARLPSTRTLARDLGVSRSTTSLAYELLLMEGYLESRVGRGTVVSRHAPATMQSERFDRAAVPRGMVPETAAIRLAPHIQSLRALPSANWVDDVPNGAFTGGQPALDLFPYDLWARLLARRARQSLPNHAYYQAAAGYLPLREAIAAHIGITRGVRCTPDQIIITAGTQGALDLAVRTLLEPGEAACIENPGYFGAQAAFIAARARLILVSVDEQGIDVDAGRERAPAPRLIFTTPSHQYPTGVTMSFGRRLALLAWARERGAWILEDDYDSEYRFSGRPLEALQGLDQVGRVLYIGSFSKLLFPSLRVGYLVAPMELVEPLLVTRRFVDVHLPILEQMALADFLHDGHFARHLRRMSQNYSERRDCLHHALRAHLGHLLDIYLPEAGMQLVGWLPPGIDDRRATALAEDAGITVAPISRFSLEPLPRGGLLFGFAGTDEAAIELGVKKLAVAFEQL